MDSSSGIDLANDPVNHSSSKHIARRDLFIRELVEREVLTPKYVKSAQGAQRRRRAHQTARARPLCRPPRGAPRPPDALNYLRFLRADARGTGG